MRNPPNWYDRSRDKHGNVIRKLVAPPPKPKTIEGTPVPGGGCYYELPGGGSVNRMDVDCNGNPTQAALFRKGGG
jgi:hypothetical protein